MHALDGLRPHVIASDVRRNHDRPRAAPRAAQRHPSRRREVHARRIVAQLVAANVRIRALCEDEHAGADDVMAGPESIRQSERVSIIGEVIGPPRRFEERSPEEAWGELLTMAPLPVIDMLLNARATGFGHPRCVASAVADLPGRPARAFHAWVRDHAPEFRR